MSDPSPLSDADKIRLKRIAKLQQQQQQTNTSSSSPTPSGSTSATPAPVPAQPKSQPKPAPPPPPSSAAPTPIQIAKKPAATPAASARFAEPYEQWEHEVVGRILEVTLDAETAEKSNWSVVFLKDVADELVEEDPSLPRPLRLSPPLTDRLLLSRLSLPSSETEDPILLTVIASLPSQQTAFEYLAGCWKRERRERLAVTSKREAPAEEGRKRLEALEEVRRLVVSYLGLGLMDSGVFPQEHITNKPLGALELSPLFLPTLPLPPTLPLNPSDAPSLLADLASRFIPSPQNDHDSGLDTILTALFNQWNAFLLSSKLDIGSMGGSSAPSARAGAWAGTGTGWREVLNAVQGLSENKMVAGLLPTLEGFDPTKEILEAGGSKGGAEGIEYRSLVGPVTRLGAYPDGAPNIAQAYFPNPSDTPRGNIDSATSSLRGVVRGVQTSLFRLYDSLLRSSPSSRQVVLQFLARTAALNAKRAAMQVDRHTVSSESFVGNLHAVLLRLCEPFMDAGFTKIDKIDPHYYRHPSQALIDVREETKINATKEESDRWFEAAKSASVEPPAPNFISHTFFLTAHYLHIGPMHAIKEHKGYGQQISHMGRQLREMEREVEGMEAGADGGREKERARGEVERYKKKLELYRSFLLAYEVPLLDPDYLQKCVAFSNLVMAWLVRLVDPLHQHPQKRLDSAGLGRLPKEAPEEFRMLPEFLIEDITEFLSFASKYAPQVLEQSPQDELMTFMLVFLSTPYMKNPYLKGQFVEIMYYLSRPTYTSPRGCLGDVINFHELALKNLMPCLVHAYIEIEITGSHTQFYDKFNIRYYITQLFKMVWSNPTHRESLKRESEVNFDRYVRFVNLLMNDTTYLLDDALVHLAKIVEIQRLQDDTSAWNALSQQEKQEKEKLLRQYESSAKSDLDLGHESLRLLKLFAAETTKPFLTPEIVDRLAAMLDSNLSLLAGPRCQDLKVKDAQQYRFNPRELLADVLEIFLLLGKYEEFQAAVAKDGRSYSRELFERATRIARNRAIKTAEELEGLGRLVERVEEIKRQEEEDEAMGEVPDEFLDPLTYDLMRDPVLLPSSRTIVDRSTIKQHYLSDPTDPFNRQPLKWEEIVEAVELKRQIEGWREERRRKKLAGGAGGVGGEGREGGEGEAMKLD
ncbi:hypothetical protein JCM8547_007662 [Rhodosporidiobolus lusitaniae]